MSKTVYAGGTFDCFHYGHVAFLRQCAEHGFVVVGLNTDEFAERYKRRPIFTYSERARVLLGCRYVKDVIPNVGDEDSRVAIAQSGADYVAHGDDWTGDALKQQMGLDDQWLEAVGIEMLYVPYTGGISTSEVIKRCALLS